MNQGGYMVGPTLAPDERPFRDGWEQHPQTDDGHLHEWECVLLAADGRYRVRIEEVVRCSVCLCPRCGHVHDDPPCMRRRHHDGAHAGIGGTEE